MIRNGAGATLLGWLQSGVRLDVHWVVLSAAGKRGEEACLRRRHSWLAPSAQELSFASLGTVTSRIRAPSQIKDWFETLRPQVNPDVIFSHWQGDEHQDHREVSMLTWNTFRDHLILEYRSPKVGRRPR